MARLCLGIAVLLSLTAHLFLHERVWENRAQVRSEIPAGYVIPSKFSRVLAVGNHGLLSDFLFLKTLTFFGGKAGGTSALEDEDWQFLIKSLEVVTDLDPYFVDPYFLAEGLFVWDANMPEVANRLLKKGVEARPWDWRLPFFIGFNYFYFMNDFASASEHIMSASRLPDSPEYLKTLGARLAYYGGKSKTALLFLMQMLEETDDPLLRKRLELRLHALERATLIEGALEQFIGAEGRNPDPLNELVTSGYLSEMPVDPYGGEWFMMKSGRIFSTSKFATKSLEKKEK